MMYITAMRVFSAKQGRGTNIFLHQPVGAIQSSDPWRVMNHPGPTIVEFDWREVQPGGNRVEAYLDLFFQEEDYEPDLLTRTLDVAWDRIVTESVNLTKVKLGPVHVVFSVNQNLGDLMSKRRVFEELKSALLRWESHHATSIAHLTGGLKAAG